MASFGRTVLCKLKAPLDKLMTGDIRVAVLDFSVLHRNV